MCVGGEVGGGLEIEKIFLNDLPTTKQRGKVIVPATSGHIS